VIPAQIKGTKHEFQTFNPTFSHLTFFKKVKCEKVGLTLNDHYTMGILLGFARLFLAMA